MLITLTNITLPLILIGANQHDSRRVFVSYRERTIFETIHVICPKPHALSFVRAKQAAARRVQPDTDRELNTVTVSVNSVGKWMTVENWSQSSGHSAWSRKSSSGVRSPYVVFENARKTRGRALTAARVSREPRAIGKAMQRDLPLASCFLSSLHHVIAFALIVTTKRKCSFITFVNGAAVVEQCATRLLQIVALKATVSANGAVALSEMMSIESMHCATRKLQAPRASNCG